MHSGYASAEMASSGTTTTGTLTELEDKNELMGVGVIWWHWESLEILESLTFGSADSSTPDVDSIVGTTTTGLWLVVETPNTRAEVGGDAGGVHV